MGDPKKLQNEIENSAVLSDIKDKNMRERIMAELSKRLSDYMWNQKYYVLQGAIGPGLEAAKLTRLDGYWDIVLENKGSMAAKNVRLKLPGLAYTRITREKYDDNSTYASLIEVNELQPLEKLSIEALGAPHFCER